MAPEIREERVDSRASSSPLWRFHYQLPREAPWRWFPGSDEANPDEGIFTRKKDAKQYAARCAVQWLMTEGLMPNDGVSVSFPAAHQFAAVNVGNRSNGNRVGSSSGGISNNINSGNSSGSNSGGSISTGNNISSNATANTSNSDGGTSGAAASRTANPEAAHPRTPDLQRAADTGNQPAALAAALHPAPDNPARTPTLETRPQPEHPPPYIPVLQQQPQQLPEQPPQQPPQQPLQQPPQPQSLGPTPVVTISPGGIQTMESFRRGFNGTSSATPAPFPLPSGGGSAAPNSSTRPATMNQGNRSGDRADRGTAPGRNTDFNGAVDTQKLEAFCKIVELGIPQYDLRGGEAGSGGIFSGRIAIPGKGARSETVVDLPESVSVVENVYTRRAAREKLAQVTLQHLRRCIADGGIRMVNKSD